jgi:hypothetical protein
MQLNDAGGWWKNGIMHWKTNIPVKNAIKWLLCSTIFFANRKHHARRRGSPACLP